MTATTSPNPAPAFEGDNPSVRSAGAWCAPITGYRGIAAILVVVGHSFMASRIYPFTSIIHCIGLIVPTFFVVSAYALYRPFLVADVAGRPLPSSKRFWWKRFLRIYPLYFVALTSYLILLPGVRPASGSTLDYIKLYTFLQVYDPDLSTFSGIPAAWFLCDEVAFYLFLPLLVISAQAIARWGRGRTVSAKRRLQGHVRLAIGMIVVGMVARTYLVINEVPAATSLPISNLDYYGFGILLAAASVAERRNQRLPNFVEGIRNRPWLAPAALIIGLAAMNVVARHPGQSFSPREDIGRYALYTLMVVPLMIVMVLGDQHRGWVGKLGSSKWTWLAMLSLHVYLWHQLFLGVFDRYVTKIDSVPHLGPRFTTGAAIAAAAGIITLTWSALTRPVLDLPYRRWSDSVPRPASAPPLLPSWGRPVALGLVLALIAGGAVVALEFGGSPLQAQGGVTIVQVTDAEPGDTLVLERSGSKLDEKTADAQGATVFRDLDPATYTVAQRRSGRLVVERDATVTGVDDHPDPSLYTSQQLHPGTNMIEMRDGTTLAAYVTLPGPESEGPYPTVVENSAYRIGDPGTVSTETAAGGTEEIQGTQPATAVARALGYATVGVNVRGTGCSGGGFDLFGDAQAADGYDVVETVAAQPWVAGHEVGLVGFSYGGLSALQVAATQPPSLSSVVALSVYGDAWQALHPGGLDNAGFPVGWLRDLQADAEPAGAEWISQRIAGGDDACAANQALHGQQTDMADRYLGAVPDDGRFGPLSPTTWARDVDVPVLVSSQFQDTTLGADLAENFTAFHDAPVARLVLGNGTHGDGIAPQVLSRVSDFLGLYVADVIPEPLDTESLLEETRPDVDPDLVPAGPRPSLDLQAFDDVEAARTAYAAEPPIEVLWEAGGADPEQAAVARWATTATTWPPKGTDAQTLYLGPGGQLVGTEPGAAPAAQLTTSVAAASVPYSTEGSDLVNNEFSGWDQPDPAHHAAWRSAPFTEDTALAGTAGLDLWVRTDTADVDLQALLLEVSDRGDETLIQTGWQRGSYRTLESGSTPLRPIVEFDPDANAPIQPGTWTRVHLRFSSFAHVLRAGSSLRLLVGTPGAAQVQWSFSPPPEGAADVEIGQGGDQASALVIPVSSADIEPGQPSCGALRGQPCRPYEPFDNAERAPDAS